MYLRALVRDIRDSLSDNDIPSLQVRTLYADTIHPETKDWEINVYSMSEKIEILSVIRNKMGEDKICYDRLTHAEIKKL